MIVAGKTKTCKPKMFDLASKDDDQELKTWCCLHWHSIFFRAVKIRNSPIYHDCCVYFSR